MKHLSLLACLMLVFKGMSAQVHPEGASSAKLIIDYTSISYTTDLQPQLYVQFSVINNTNKEQVYLTGEDAPSMFFSVDNEDLILPPDNKNVGNNSYIHRTIASHGSMNIGLIFKLRHEPDSVFRFKLGMKLVPYSANANDIKLRNVETTWSDVNEVKLKRGRTFYERAIKEKAQRNLQEPLPIYHALTPQERNDYALTVDSGKIGLPVDTSMYFFVDKRKTKFLLCYVNLENHSNDTLAYVTMNCNYLNIFLVDNKDFSIPPIMCYKNGPEVVKIPPHGARKMSIPLMINRFGPENRKFRMGMSLQKFVSREQLRFDPELYLLRPETSNLIWSNEVHIP